MHLSPLLRRFDCEPTLTPGTPPAGRTGPAQTRPSDQLRFQDLFCGRFHCHSGQYERKAFSKLLYGHARLVAPLICKLSPDFFAEDFKFIRYLGQTTEARGAKLEAADFKDANAARRSFWRTGLRIRVSGGRAIQLARRLFSSLPANGASAAE